MTEHNDFIAHFALQEIENERNIKVLTKSVPHTTLYNVARQAILAQNEHIDRLCESEYVKYKKLASQGIPYSQRIAKIDTQRMKILQSMKIENFKVRPFSDFITYHDYRYIKEVGLNDFVRSNLQRIVY